MITSSSDTSAGPVSAIQGSAVGQPLPASAPTAMCHWRPTASNRGRDGLVEPAFQPPAVDADREGARVLLERDGHPAARHEDREIAPSIRPAPVVRCLQEIEPRSLPQRSRQARADGEDVGPVLDRRGEPAPLGDVDALRQLLARSRS